MLLFLTCLIVSINGIVMIQDDLGYHRKLRCWGFKLCGAGFRLYI